MSYGKIYFHCLIPAVDDGIMRGPGSAQGAGLRRVIYHRGTGQGAVRTGFPVAVRHKRKLWKRLSSGMDMLVSAKLPL